MASTEIEQNDSETVELVFAIGGDQMSQSDLLHQLVHKHAARILSRNISAHSSLYNLTVDDIPLLLYKTSNTSNRLAGRGPEAIRLLQKLQKEFIEAQLSYNAEN